MEKRPSSLKVAISRLKQDDKFIHKQRRQPRTQRACGNVSIYCRTRDSANIASSIECRAQKVRCTGGLRCQRCVEQDATCIYTQNRRDRLNEAIEKNNDLIDLLRNLSTHVDEVGKKMIDDYLNGLREDDDIPVSATERKAGTLGAVRNRSRKHSLSHESSPAHSRTELNIPESFHNDAVGIPNEDVLRSQKSRTPNDTNMTQSTTADSSLPQTKWGRSCPTTPSMAVATTSSINLPPDGPSPCFSLSAHYPTTKLDIMRMQNLNAFRAQQQVPCFGNLQSDPNLILYLNSPVPLVIGNPFATNFGQPGMLFNHHLLDEQMSSAVDFQTYNSHSQNI